MELTELKKLLDEQEPDTGPEELKAHLSSVRQSRSDIVHLLKSNLLIELWLVLISGSLVAVYYFSAYGGALEEIGWFYIILSIGFVAYFYKKALLLQKLQSVNRQVKANLQVQLRTLEQWVFYYQWTGVVLVPVLMVFFYIVLKKQHFTLHLPFDLGVGGVYFNTFYLLFTVIFTVIVFIINKWWVYRSYGRYIKEFKELVAEMEEEKSQ